MTVNVVQRKIHLLNDFTQIVSDLVGKLNKLIYSNALLGHDKLLKNLSRNDTFLFEYMPLECATQLNHTSTPRKNLMSEQIAQRWLDDSAQTASEGDFAAHMNLISKEVQVHGVPEFEVIGYQDWFNQCQHEFANKVLASLHYDGLKMVATTEQRVMFKTVEVSLTNEGEQSQSGVEVVLAKEDDGQWRVIQERILSDDETRHAGLPLGQ